MKNFLFLLLFGVVYNVSGQINSLHDPANQYDYIIITIPEYIQSCNQFASHKETNIGLRTLVVDTTMIFNEFNSFVEPQENIREFISYAGTYWTDPKPKFVLIVGKSNEIPNFKIPFLNQGNYYFHSDFYYSQNKFESDSISMDFFVGRLPCRNNLELNRYFNKVIAYETTGESNAWVNNCLLIADTVPTFNFLNTSLVLQNDFPSYIKPKIVTIDTSSEYFGNKDSVINYVNDNGVSSVWFEGLGRQDFFISEDFLNLSDLNLFENLNKYFLTIFVYAQFNILDTNTNLAREFLFKGNSGSIASIHHTSFSFWVATKYFQTLWAQRLYDTAYHSLGEVINSQENLISIYWHNYRALTLWGDPSLKIKFNPATSVKYTNSLQPNSFELYQNFPNPFNGLTKIKWYSPVSAHQTIKIYDFLGREIMTLVDGYINSGENEILFDASNLASGIYFYKLTAGNSNISKKMIYLK